MESNHEVPVNSAPDNGAKGPPEISSGGPGDFFGREVPELPAHREVLIQLCHPEIKALIVL
jgi:hypothetical protein